MKNLKVFLLEIFQFLVVKFSVYLNRRVFVMSKRNEFAPEGSMEKICSYGEQTLSF